MCARANEHMERNPNEVQAEESELTAHLHRSRISVYSGAEYIAWKAQVNSQDNYSEAHPRRCSRVNLVGTPKRSTVNESPVLVHRPFTPIRVAVTFIVFQGESCHSFRRRRTEVRISNAS